MIDAIEAQLLKGGFERDVSGLWHRPGAKTLMEQHEHSHVCTVDSCGRDAMFFCVGSYCIRASRADGKRRGITRIEDVERRPCTGHYVRSREELIKYTLDHKELKVGAPAGTPLDDDTVNTWSDEHERASS